MVILLRSYHYICLGINKKQHQNDGFYCPSCENVESDQFIPLLFREKGDLRGKFMYFYLKPQLQIV